MARRKQAEDAMVEEWDGADFAEFLEPFAPSAEELGPLADVVLSYLDKRNELAQKLAAEIEATERKLAELRRTAAALFPEAVGEAASEEAERERPERKAKKPTAPKVKLTQPESGADEPEAKPEVEAAPQAPVEEPAAQVA